MLNGEFKFRILFRIVQLLFSSIWKKKIKPSIYVWKNKEKLPFKVILYIIQSPVFYEKFFLFLIKVTGVSRLIYDCLYALVLVLVRHRWSY